MCRRRLDDKGSEKKGGSRDALEQGVNCERETHPDFLSFPSHKSVTLEHLSKFSRLKNKTRAVYRLELHSDSINSRLCVLFHSFLHF